MLALGMWQVTLGVGDSAKSDVWNNLGKWGVVEGQVVDLVEKNLTWKSHTHKHRVNTTHLSGSHYLPDIFLKTSRATVGPYSYLNDLL